MSAATSPATGRDYGVQRVCLAWAFPRASYYAANPAAFAGVRTGKRGPKSALDDAVLLALIRGDLATSPFSGEGHRKVLGRLGYVAGHRVGRNRILRLMRPPPALAPPRPTRARRPAGSAPSAATRARRRAARY